MKKSTLIVCIAILVAFLTPTVANLKLKKEYEAGHIVTNYVEKKIPPFRFIKETLSGRGHYGAGFVVSRVSDKDASISVHFDEQDRLDFHVRNDTLYIENISTEKKYNPLYYAIYISTGKLEKVEATNGTFFLGKSDFDSISIIAKGNATVNLNVRKIKKLSVESSAMAEINLYASYSIKKYNLADTSNITGNIEFASIHLKDFSSFSVEDVIIKQKLLSFSKATSLRLAGISLQTFRVN